jgi:hypothetical protein
MVDIFGNYFLFPVKAFRSFHPRCFGHLNGHDAVKLLHPPSHERAKMDRRNLTDVRRNLTDVRRNLTAVRAAIGRLKPRRFQATARRGATTRFDIELND